jgi:N-acetylmuramoyl-L-alanine amidase
MQGGFTIARVLALTVLWLGALLVGGAPLAAAESAQAPGTVRGEIQGSAGGAHVAYSLAYPGDGSSVAIRLDIDSSDVNVIRGTGVNVYGPTAGKVYANTAADGASSRAVDFSSSEPGNYLIQVFSYVPVRVGFSLTVNRPLALPLSSGPAVPPTAASRPGASRTIVLDPGHGGPEIGAVGVGGGPREKDVNLRIALRLADILRADGYRVVLTRDSDRAVKPGRDLQGRIDVANAAKADLFICIHNNGGAASQSGTEVWYDPSRPFADRNLKLAQLVQSNLVAQIRALGYPVRDRGIKNDSRFRVYNGRAYSIYVLGPGTGYLRYTPTKMPGVLGESLFLSNPGDAAMLRQDRTLDVIARGYRDAINAYFQCYPS